MRTTELGWSLVGNKRLSVWQHWIDQSRALSIITRSGGPLSAARLAKIPMWDQRTNQLYSVLWGGIDRGRIPPSQIIPDHMDYPADHTPVVHARNATRPRVKESNAPKLSPSQPELIRHRQVVLPRLNHDVTSDGI